MTPVPCPTCYRPPTVDTRDVYVSVLCEHCYDGAPDGITLGGSGVGRSAAIADWNDRVEAWLDNGEDVPAEFIMAVIGEANVAQHEGRPHDASALMELLTRITEEVDVPHDDRLCQCGSGKPWASKMEVRGVVTTECEDCWPRHDAGPFDHSRDCNLDHGDLP